VQLFPKLVLEEIQPPTGEWVIASREKPLTKQEAYAVIAAYSTFRELLKTDERD
jgi:hypothetical protein